MVPVAESELRRAWEVDAKCLRRVECCWLLGGNCEVAVPVTVKAPSERETKQPALGQLVTYVTVARPPVTELAA